ncbi:hypothetical protein PIIN_07888 [Serendipita indica DSM 11827]|uniref:Uncharacterized protein n=1 Tax=Serendipita indica (strain DSM 11827) TaxID=1109443 RepID=G4TRJ2_SERID|nr:hypothetical protein PIIN_07888 [Serendipita indica DSM 11827]
MWPSTAHPAPCGFRAHLAIVGVCSHSKFEAAESVSPLTSTYVFTHTSILTNRRPYLPTPYRRYPLAFMPTTSTTISIVVVAIFNSSSDSIYVGSRSYFSDEPQEWRNTTRDESRD